MDTVLIEGLRVDTIIGIHPWERRVRQSLYVDAELYADFAAAAASEAIEDAIDYYAVSLRIQAFIREGEFQLLETLADSLADDLLQGLAIAGLRLRVSKPGALVDAGSVGVEVVRGAAGR